MSWILGIDPGPEQSGIAYYNESNHSVEYCAVLGNYEVLSMLESLECANPHVVIEDVVNYGKVVGASTFKTSEWKGRFIQKWYSVSGREPVSIKRQQVKSVICGTVRAGNPQVRQAVIDQFPATGGGKQPQVGTKKAPGPLYGIKSHAWSALALALTYSRIRNEL